MDTSTLFVGSSRSANANYRNRSASTRSIRRRPSTWWATPASSLTVDTTTLVVDSTNNRIGVNQATPTASLDVVGDSKITGRLQVGRDLLLVQKTNNQVGIRQSSPEVELGVHVRQGLGSLQVDANSLIVDAVNKRVGILRATPRRP